MAKLEIGYGKKKKKKDNELTVNGNINPTSITQAGPSIDTGGDNKSIGDQTQETLAVEKQIAENAQIGQKARTHEKKMQNRSGAAKFFKQDSDAS